MVESISHIKSHVGQCIYNSESTNKKYEIFHIERGITCTINCNYRIAARLYPRNMFFFQVCKLQVPCVKVKYCNNNNNNNNNNGNYRNINSNDIPTVQPTRCTCYLKLYILVQRSTFFGRSFRPSSGS